MKQRNGKRPFQRMTRPQTGEKDWDMLFVGKTVRITKGEHRNREGIVLGRRIGGDNGVQFLVGHVFVERPQRTIPVGVGEMELIN